MTKEEAKLVLDNARPQTKEIDRQFYDDEDLNNALDMAIKALEQQPSDDCVSRAEVLKGYIEINRADGVEVYSDKVIPMEYVEALPPVTPTHGKCKDCTNYVAGALDEEICLRGHELIHKDFYCADFEKRGSEND